jgi:hypothetical protein
MFTNLQIFFYNWSQTTFLYTQYFNFNLNLKHIMNLCFLIYFLEIALSKRYEKNKVNKYIKVQGKSYIYQYVYFLRNGVTRIKKRRKNLLPI